MPLTFKNARVSTILPIHNSSGRQDGYRVGHSVSSRKCWIPNLGTESLSACDRGTVSLIGKATWFQVSGVRHQTRYRSSYCVSASPKDADLNTGT